LLQRLCEDVGVRQERRHAQLRLSVGAGKASMTDIRALRRSSAARHPASIAEIDAIFFRTVSICTELLT
jgi:hypothetical protein